MLTNILHLEGAQQLNRKQQSSINGGDIDPVCMPHDNGVCYRCGSFCRELQCQESDCNE